jgi:hypothetical protein
MDNQHPVDDAEYLTRTYELLTEAARRAQDQPPYVAWALARVQAREGLSDEALAARLGLATVDLPRLALCLRPRPGQWDADLAQIAARFGLAPEALATILHAVETPGEPRHHPTGYVRRACRRAVAWHVLARAIEYRPLRLV